MGTIMVASCELGRRRMSYLFIANNRSLVVSRVAQQQHDGITVHDTVAAAAGSGSGRPVLSIEYFSAYPCICIGLCTHNFHLNAESQCIICSFNGIRQVSPIHRFREMPALGVTVPYEKCEYHQSKYSRVDETIQKSNCNV
jgi:hypothetical protein